MGYWEPTPAARRAAIYQAGDEGNFIVFGGPKLLQLDLGSFRARDRAEAAIDRFRHALGLSDITTIWTRSKSDNWHAYIPLPKPMERIKRLHFQTLLGDDPARAHLNYVWYMDVRHGWEAAPLSQFTYKPLQSVAAPECFLVETPDEVKRLAEFGIVAVPAAEAS